MQSLLDRVVPIGPQFSVPSQHIMLTSWENMPNPHEPLFQQHSQNFHFQEFAAVVVFFFNVIHLFRFSTFAPCSKRSKSKAKLV